MEQLWHCRLAAYKVYKLKQEPNGASMQLQVSYLLQGYQLEWEPKGPILGLQVGSPQCLYGFISSKLKQVQMKAIWATLGL